MSDLITLQNVYKTFTIGLQSVTVLKGISFTITSEDFIVLLGPSGCGKSTTLHILLGLEAPTSGMVLFMGKDMQNDMDTNGRADIRKNNIGIVYQQSNWIKSMNVVENVMLPQLLSGAGKADAMYQAYQMLEIVEMLEWADHMPGELSSGQQQKVALARALVNDPRMIVLDEPTGNLDYASGQKLLNILAKLNEQGKCIVMVTHDLEYISFAKTVIRMFDGTVARIYQEAEKGELMQEVAAHIISA